jgi:hypothetical protein
MVTGEETMRLLAGMAVLAGVLVAGGLAVRLAPHDPARWHVAPALPGDLGPGRVITAGPGGAVLRLEAQPGAGEALLARLDAVAMATPRTARLAGSVAEGRITWITRSAVWGFPDYTTAARTGERIDVHARLRFGRSDLGVNAARLTAWAAQLDQP